MKNIRINAALTEQVTSLLDEYAVQYTGDEVIAFTTLEFATLAEFGTARHLISLHFGDSAILATDLCAA